MLLFRRVAAFAGGFSMLSTKSPYQLNCVPPPALLLWGKRLQARAGTTDLACKRVFAVKGAPMLSAATIVLNASDRGMCTHFAEIVQRSGSAKTRALRRAQCHAHSAYSGNNNSNSAQNVTPTPNVAVLDKLITVFASKSPIEWRKLIAHSKQWPQLSDSVLTRCNTV